ncbi:glycine betaine uptake BCCT transporter [Geosporobacter ferrireducens]|uniref:Glycine/betaine ABC transporter permease n=1 Tax=Geosporobacter ferrireducens TaxID=1424294 RepID=A0A1D8GF00_9FIRM|nr:BCCT family transporter [Geosporobacter ferrireducens]AOT69483.1 glycine/betaine ABC transporter permease [Geosporobacter ferrireducens]
MKKYFGNYDKTISEVSAVFCLIFVAVTMVKPIGVQKVFNSIFRFFISNFGWYYLLCGIIFLIVCFTLAFSKYGEMRLGKDDEKPEFSLFSWFSMLFSAGMGIGLVFWGVAEPIYHFAGPPFAEPGTAAAAVEAMRYSFFHWGLHPWASYGVVALCLAYFQFRKDMPGLISSTLLPVLGEKGMKGPTGKAVDTFTIIVSLFGIATSLGLGAMTITTGLNFVYDIPNTVTTSIVVIAVITVMFIISAVTGVEKGIKWLSNINMSLALMLMAFLFLSGPTRFIINIMIESIGSYAQNILWMSFFLDTQGVVAEHTGYDWVGTWTIFYWAWWITWVPFVGSFLARISRGRTIREFVLGVLVAPTLLSCIWFAILGGSAMHIEMFGTGGITEAAHTELTSAIFTMFTHFPMTGLLSVLTMIIVAIFFVTSADSSTYVISMMTSSGNLNPSSGLRVFWGIISGGIGVALVLAGGLSAVQAVSFALTFPFAFLMLIMIYCLYQSLREEKAINDETIVSAQDTGQI